MPSGTPEGACNRFCCAAALTTSTAAPANCGEKHDRDDKRLGEPLCPDCYDYTRGGPVQTPLLRHHPARRSRRADHAPPGWATLGLLTAAIGQAARAVSVTTPAAPGLPARTLVWGRQLDVRPVTAHGDVTDTKVAGYVAIRHQGRRRLEIEQIGRKSGAVAHLVQADFPSFDLAGLAQEVAGLLPAMRQLLTIGAAPDTPGLRIEDLQDLQISGTDHAELLQIAESLDVHGPAVLQLSGGTTGTPKLIPRLHAEYRYNADLTSSWWGHTEHSVLAFGLPLAHNAALANGLHAAHGAGAALLLATPAADVMLPLMAEHGATWTMSPPGLAKEYLSHPAFGDAVARLGTWVLTAARVPRPVFDELTGRGVHVTQAFGMSEGLFLFTPLDAPAGLRAETVGIPISALDEVRVLRPGTDVEVAEGETGELAARGPYTIRGYLAAPDRDRDREAFTAEGFYQSGDLVRARRYQGTLSYSIEGRMKDLIDRGGEKINAEEVERLVAGHPAVAEIALVGMPDLRLGERGCAYIVPRDPQNPPTLAGICSHLEAEGLAKYKWPERLELIDTLPRTQVGKISKVTLRADIDAKLKHETTPRTPAVTA